MESRVRVARHPLHPMLIVFPSTLFPLLLLMDVLAWWLGNDAFWSIGVWLAGAGVVTTLAAMVPGIVDMAAVPDESRAHRTVLWHFIVGTATLVAYAAGTWLRWNAGTDRLLLATVVDVVGVLLVTAQGWLGGELVYKHHLGVKTVAEGADPVTLTGATRAPSERGDARRRRDVPP